MWYPLALILSLTLVTLAAKPRPIVDLGYAQYEGSLSNNTGNLEFLGIRFAAPPTGALRWRAPQAPKTAPGIQRADTPPNRCWSADDGKQPETPFPVNSNSKLTKRAVPGFSEDCLFLNVVTPASGNGNLPVLVWIHGGGYISGSASGFTGADPFDGDDLVRDAGGGVVAVIIQYRLGVFGFLPGQKVRDGGVLNAGLLDQQFALQWVQRHISKFGGDPSRVTIWGESAGAGSVMQQVLANDGNTQPPLFRAAIQLFATVVNGTKCGAAHDALDCLRKADVDTLQQLNTQINADGFFGTFTFVPVVDGHFIVKRPTELMREGKVNGEALLAVTNAFEGTPFVDARTANTVQIPNYLANLFPEFGDAQVTAGTAQYANMGTPLQQAVAIMGESIFICPTYFMLRAFRNKAFKGEFAVPPAGHGEDVIYYFPNMNAGVFPPFNNTIFINNFAQSFLNFAISLDPNVKWDPANTVPQWSKWSEERRVEMLFNKTDANVPVFRSITTADGLIERCNFWESVGALSGQ
ncbi:hypothetical protein D9756_005124 [Leucocoprinus leucothites]|uniref:Carboxylic ester hydrolase n=1 Tax=Leucocoprinus leucothites TaxID=201217 RepID=A0A8H5G9X9_9AGAR|nr:hypothetical protein D9756_005124 [Leucoagaricus leucothites]